MLLAYRLAGRGLERLPADAPLEGAVWIDLYRPLPEQVARVNALGVEVPSLAEMEEIEISNRLYREGGADYMTVVLPGHTPNREHVAGPVTFILTPTQLITVRHHAPRPFETFADRAARSSAGCADHRRVFLGLCEEIVSRLADLLEGAGKALDQVAAEVYGGEGAAGAAGSQRLQAALQAVGREGEVLARVRLGLLTLERMLSTYGVWSEGGAGASALKPLIKALMRDIQALEVHADFLSGRVSLTTDTTLGMVNLAQNATVRIVSVVAVLFLPPTLIGTVYGMNFEIMPELDWPWGYPMSLGAMVLSALLTWLYFRWKGWL